MDRAERDDQHGRAPEAQFGAGGVRPGRALVGSAVLGRVLRRAEVGAVGGLAPPGMSTALQALGSGISVPNRALRSLEAGLGLPLDDVRVHSGSAEVALADQVSARAFTVGHDVVLGAGSADPDPDTATGYHLLAHEVVHTLQPGTGGTALTVGPAGSPAEQEAEAIATQLTDLRFGTGPAAIDAVDTPTGAGASRTIRRFGRDEHQQLGDATGDTVDLGGGMVLTWGQVVGLAGDEFGSVNDLRAMAQNDPAKLRSILSSDSVHSPDYVTLALNNITHFAGGGTAVQSWEQSHRGALLAAILAGVHDSYPELQDAMLTEAFGQHYLTDSFSGGHIRTPRQEIIDWYSNDFAPRVISAFIDHAGKRLRDGLVVQIHSQVAAPDAVVDAEIQALMNGALAWFADDVRTTYTPLFGLGIAGAISGVLHDRDNERGLWVSSEIHPDPWLAYGDGKLVCSPTSAEQAKAAVVAAHDEVVKARTLGDNRRTATATPPIPMAANAAPGVVHFAFDSAAIDVGTLVAVQEVADYLVSRPELVVDLTGHTDPLGTDGYNDGLGQRRSDAIAAELMRRGVAPTRLHSTSAGERQLLSAERSGFAGDRRVELTYRPDGAAPDDVTWAQQTVDEQFPGPPYPTIEKFLPHEVPGRNDPQEGWTWGVMSSEMAAEIDSWITHYVNSYSDGIVKNKELDDRTVPLLDLSPTSPVGVGPVVVTIHPRPLVVEILGDLLKGPTAFVGTLVGVPPANHSTPAPPPPVACP